MKFELSWQIFEKVWNIKFHQNPSSGSRVVPCGHTDGRTDGYWFLECAVSNAGTGLCRLRLPEWTASRGCVIPLCSSGKELNWLLKCLFACFRIIQFHIYIASANRAKISNRGCCSWSRSPSEKDVLEPGRSRTCNHSKTREGSVSSSACAVVAGCQKYDLSRPISWKYIYTFRATWILPKVWRLESKSFGHSIPLYVLYFF